MNITRRELTVAGLGLMAAGSIGSPATARDGLVANLPEGLDEFASAVEAYIYAYPLVTMEITRRVITNVAETEGTRGPMGHIIKLRRYPDAKFRDVTAPNADTLYTTAFFDVGDEPWVVSLPDLNDRYALSDVGWLATCSTFPGKRTSGTGAQTFVVTGPDGKASLAKGSSNTSLRRASSGCSGASTAPEPQRTTPKSTSCRMK